MRDPVNALESGHRLASGFRHAMMRREGREPPELAREPSKHGVGSAGRHVHLVTHVRMVYQVDCVRHCELAMLMVEFRVGAPSSP